MVSSTLDVEGGQVGARAVRGVLGEQVSCDLLSKVAVDQVGSLRHEAV